jgi:alkanesulfonate monooxygenase SsuD/methylene tetrahydromethanopterin reductase-like flavin-dependent oxidoreductase (luciferase family)
MDSKVKFCVRVHQGGYSYPEILRIWKDADRLGYYSASLYDLLNIPTLECWTTLSALASETENIKLIPMVLANTYREPVLMAKMASTLDVISDGRVELGIGAGGGRRDHAVSGYAFPSTSIRSEMLSESVSLIKKLWTEDDVEFEGTYYRLTGANQEPKPIQKPHPPVLIGGHGEKHVLRAVASQADMCNIGNGMSLADHDAKLAVLSDYCRQIGRDPGEIEITHNTSVVIAPNDLAFERLVKQNSDRLGKNASDYRSSLNNAIAGTPQECITKIKSYVNHGIRYFFLIFPDPISTNTLELFANEVMPAFAT